MRVPPLIFGNSPTLFPTPPDLSIDSGAFVALRASMLRYRRWRCLAAAPPSRWDDLDPPQLSRVRQPV
jgi:hypothetical protein